MESSVKDLIIPKRVYAHFQGNHQELAQWAIGQYNLDCAKCGGKNLYLTFAGDERSIESGIILAATCQEVSCGHIMYSHNGLNPAFRQLS